MAFGWPAEVAADGEEGGDEGAHVGFGVEGCRGDAQAFLAARRWINAGNCLRSLPFLRQCLGHGGESFPRQALNSKQIIGGRIYLAAGLVSS